MPTGEDGKRHLAQARLNVNRTKSFRCTVQPAFDIVLVVE